MPIRTLRRSRHIWLLPQVWRKRLIFWMGGACVGMVAVAFAVGAEYAEALFRWLVDA
jgi:hypothetical protein